MRRFLACLFLLLGLSPSFAQFNGASGIYALNGQTFGLISTGLKIVSGGSGYASGDTLSLTCPAIGAANKTLGTVTVGSVSSGAITSVAITTSGNYTALPSTGDASAINGVCSFTQASTSGSGSGAVISILLAFNAASSTTTYVGPLQFGYSTTLGLGSAANYPASAFTTAARSAKYVLVTDYGASGSGFATTGAVSSGGNAATLAAAGDFVNGQGICLFGAGAAFSQAQPSSISAVQVGAGGSTTYTYYIAALDYAGGIGVPVQATVSSANATLSYANHITITLTSTASGGYGIWKKTGSGTPVWIGTGTAGTYVDTGFVPSWLPSFIPATPPSVAQADWLVTTVTSGGGTTALVLAASASTTVSGANVQHDDTAAFNLASSSNAAAGAQINIPTGVYNLTGRVTINANFVGFQGPGRSAQLVFFGRDHNWVITGASPSSSTYGDFVNNFYENDFNKIGGYSFYVTYSAEIELSNLYLDHTASGFYMLDVNDVRMAHDRGFNLWGQNGTFVTLASDATNPTCCLFAIDVYAQGNSTTGDNWVDKLGWEFDGNVATIYCYGCAVSNIAGKGMYVLNDTGNATSPQFLQFTDFSSEFTNDVGIYLATGQTILFEDLTQSAAYATNGIVVGAAVIDSSFKGGRVSNNGANGIDIFGSKTRVSGVSFLNNSATNEGGSTAASQGVVIDSTSNGTTVIGNIIGSAFGVPWAQNYPVYVVSGAANAAITGNTFAGNTINYTYMGAGYSQTMVEANNSGEPVWTIATLPACGTMAAGGTSFFVSNGVASPTFNAAVGTTGSTYARVFCNNSNWVYQ